MEIYKGFFQAVKNSRPGIILNVRGAWEDRQVGWEDG